MAGSVCLGELYHVFYFCRSIISGNETVSAVLFRVAQVSCFLYVPDVSLLNCGSAYQVSCAHLLFL